jgi:hypothetical protein
VGPRAGLDAVKERKLYEAFSLKGWSPSDDGHHLPKHVKGFILLLKYIVARDGIKS